VAVIRKSFQYGGHTVVLERGRIARQATSAVMVTMGDTAILVSVVAKKEQAEGQSFFPLTVNYQERNYASGKIPGGYFKREGRPTEQETLTSRLIDRAMRPLFPKEFKNEIQIVATVMSTDCNIQSDIPAMIGASAALATCGAPFLGPVAAARVGLADDALTLNPGYMDAAESPLNLVIAGTEKAVLMVESQVQELPEDKMLDALRFGHDNLQVAITAINEFAAEVGAESWNWQAPAKDEALHQQVSDAVLSDLEAAYQIQEKIERYEKTGQLRKNIVEQLVKEDAEAPSAKDVEAIFAGLEKSVVRKRVIDKQPRIDGRDTETVRPISIDLGVLPRAHGSVVFTRGETQAIVAATLGTDRDAQIVDALEGEYRDSFMLHYNFPPYCVGETGFMSGPKRREIGHGRLARRGITAVLPDMNQFPYVIRMVCEITESNGSSSMASVCGSSLALMQAGVPIKSHVAGIAMGLIKEGDDFAVLTDILGDEDHLGDMDFKVAGTSDGITALQMDIKIDGITFDIMEKALAQAKDARMHILGLMNAAISTPEAKLSEFAPQITTIQIRPEQIKEIIGKGGETIKKITEETGATIDITDTGLVKIASVGSEGGKAAYQRIYDITADVLAGEIYTGKVARIMDFGAFVTLRPGKDGLVHISQIMDERVEDVRKHVEEGQEVTVKVLEVDGRGRIKLTMKPSEFEKDEQAAPAAEDDAK
jgi:polyribonucleotide nucleotidyltransferase